MSTHSGQHAQRATAFPLFGGRDGEGRGNLSCCPWKSGNRQSAIPTFPPASRGLRRKEGALVVPPCSTTPHSGGGRTLAPADGRIAPAPATSIQLNVRFKYSTKGDRLSVVEGRLVNTEPMSVSAMVPASISAAIGGHPRPVSPRELEICSPCRIGHLAQQAGRQSTGR